MRVLFALSLVLLLGLIASTWARDLEDESKMNRLLLNKLDIEEDKKGLDGKKPDGVLANLGNDKEEDDELFDEFEEEVDDKEADDEEADGKKVDDKKSKVDIKKGGEANDSDRNTDRNVDAKEDVDEGEVPGNKVTDKDNDDDIKEIDVDDDDEDDLVKESEPSKKSTESVTTEAEVAVKRTRKMKRKTKPQLEIVNKSSTASDDDSTSVPCNSTESLTSTKSSDSTASTVSCVSVSPTRHIDIPDYEDDFPDSRDPEKADNCIVVEEENCRDRLQLCLKLSEKKCEAIQLKASDNKTDCVSECIYERKRKCQLLYGNCIERALIKCYD